MKISQFTALCASLFISASLVSQVSFSSHVKMVKDCSVCKQFCDNIATSSSRASGKKPTQHAQPRCEQMTQLSQGKTDGKNGGHNYRCTCDITQNTMAHLSLGSRTGDQPTSGSGTGDQPTSGSGTGDQPTSGSGTGGQSSSGTGDRPTSGSGTGGQSGSSTGGQSGSSTGGQSGSSTGTSSGGSSTGTSSGERHHTAKPDLGEGDTDQ